MNNNPELWMAIYQKLKAIDETRKFRKTIDKHQILLDDAIRKAERENKCKISQ